MAKNNSTSDVQTYAATQIAECTLTHGYVCDEIEEDNFLKNTSFDKLLPAVYLSAWNAAYQAFLGLEDLTSVQKDLKHYRIGMTESDEDYIILFNALLLPETIVDNNPEGISRVTFGKTMKFWVNKKSLQVSKYLFYK